MSTYIHHEILLLVQALLTGAVLLLCYDILKALRRVISHSPGMVSAEDLLFWLCCTFFVFTRVYRTNQGILRLFIFLGLLAGAVICYYTVSPFFEKLCVYIMKIPVIIIKKIIKWLLFPVRRCKILMEKCAKKERLSNWVVLRKKGEKRE